jgi:hypothetical protein
MSLNLDVLQQKEGVSKVSAKVVPNLFRDLYLLDTGPDPAVAGQGDERSVFYNF